VNLEESDALVGAVILQMPTTRGRIIPVDRRDDPSPRLMEQLAFRSAGIVQADADIAAACCVVAPA
jgi:hypothetical protein